MLIPMDDTAPHGAVESQNLGTPLSGTRKDRGTMESCGRMPGSESLPYIYDSNQSGTQTVIARDDTAPHDCKNKDNKNVINHWVGPVRQPMANGALAVGVLTVVRGRSPRGNTAFVA